MSQSYLRPLSPLSASEEDEEVRDQEDDHFLHNSNSLEKVSTSPRDKRNGRIWRLIIQMLAIILTFAAVFLTLQTIRTIQQRKSDVDEKKLEEIDPKPCGTDPSTARFSGCYFDPISFAWLPPDCHDFSLTAEFLKTDHWRFWTDADPNTQSISFADVMQGRHSSLFVTEEYHRQRCVFAWRKLHRAIMNGTKVDSYVVSFDELIMCDDLLMERGKGEEKRKEAVVGFYSCLDHDSYMSL